MKRAAESARSAGWRMHGLLLGLLLLQVGFWYVTRVSRSVLLERAQQGTRDERLSALHVLANRGEPQAALFQGAALQRLLDDPDEVVRRFALTGPACKFEQPTRQLRGLLEGSAHPTAAWWIDWVLQMRKAGAEQVGAGVPLRRREFEWYCAARRGQDPPREAVLEDCEPEMEFLRVLSQERPRKRARAGKGG